MPTAFGAAADPSSALGGASLALWPVHALVLLAALAVALALRPWRGLGRAGPPWPWLAWWAVLPLLWAADRAVDIPLVPPLSGAALLVLMAGWPLAMLALPLVALMLGALGALAWPEALDRLVWLGLLPGSLALALGLALRRWAPHHLFIYILGRGFLGTWLVMALLGWFWLQAHGTPAGVQAGEAMVGRFLAASGEAFLTGMFTAIFVAYRPDWLATYTDRIYLPTTPPPGNGQARADDAPSAIRLPKQD